MYLAVGSRKYKFPKKPAVSFSGLIKNANTGGCWHCKKEENEKRRELFSHRKQYNHIVEGYRKFIGNTGGDKFFVMVKATPAVFVHIVKKELL